MSVVLATIFGGLGTSFGWRRHRASGGGGAPPSETLPHFTVIF